MNEYNCVPMPVFIIFSLLSSELIIFAQYPCQVPWSFVLVKPDQILGPCLRHFLCLVDVLLNDSLRVLYDTGQVILMYQAYKLIDT